MMNDLISFDFEGAAVRVIEVDGDPWFILADVCRVLDISNVGNASARLDDDEKDNIRNPDVNRERGNPNITIINESGLYSLILTSRKPSTKRFKKWVTSDVLPSIRKTGGYMIAAPEETPEQLALRAITVLQATVEHQKAQLAEALPKAAAHDRLSGADGSLCITDAAKALQIQRKNFIEWLSQNGWIYRRPGGTHFLGYQKHTVNGDLEHKVTTILRPDGSEKVIEQVRITPQGLTKLAKLMPERLKVVA